jgi:hypothetical protein
MTTPATAQELLRAIRERSGITVGEVATAIGYERTVLTRHLTGARPLPRRAAVRLAQYFVLERAHAERVLESGGWTLTSGERADWAKEVEKWSALHKGNGRRIVDGQRLPGGRNGQELTARRTEELVEEALRRKDILHPETGQFFRQRLPEYRLLLRQYKDARAYDDAALIFNTVQHAFYIAGDFPFLKEFAAWLVARRRAPGGDEARQIALAYEGRAQPLLRLGDLRGAAAVLDETPPPEGYTKAERRLAALFHKTQAMLWESQGQDGKAVVDAYEKAYQHSVAASWESVQIASGLALAGARLRTGHTENLYPFVEMLLALSREKDYPRREGSACLELARLHRLIEGEDGLDLRESWLDAAKTAIERGEVIDWALEARLSLELAVLHNDRGRPAEANRYYADAHRRISRVVPKIGRLLAPPRDTARSGKRTREAYRRAIEIFID